jgi:hypothetical protein
MLCTSVKSRKPKRESRLDLDKTVTFVVTLSSGGQLIRTDIESIRRSAAIYMDLLGTLENFLDLPTVPFCVSNGQDNTAIRSLEELWKFIDSAEEPFIRLCTWTTNTLVVVPSRTIERTLQQNYSNHAILKLEHMVDKLDNQEQSRLSHQSRFTLIREIIATALISSRNSRNTSCHWTKPPLHDGGNCPSARRCARQRCKTWPKFTSCVILPLI